MVPPTEARAYVQGVAQWGTPRIQITMVSTAGFLLLPSLKGYFSEFTGFIRVPASGWTLQGTPYSANDCAGLLCGLRAQKLINSHGLLGWHKPGIV